MDDLLLADYNSPDYTLLLARASMLGTPILSAVTRRLDAFDPRSLEMLGRLIGVYPDVREVVTTLRRTASDHRRSDRRRMGAVMLLEQVFGLHPPDDFLSTLREPVQSATGLLLSALDNHGGSPLVLRDYLRALVFQPLDLLYSVLAALAEAGEDRSVDVLCLLALQPDHDLQMGVLEALAARGTSSALKALRVLELTLPDEAGHTANRHLQKLLLSGVEVSPLRAPDSHCRAWLSAIDGRGDRQLWLAVPAHDTEGEFVLLGLLLNDQSGVLDALGAGGVLQSSLPSRSSIGTLRPDLDFTALGMLPADASLGEHAGGYLDVPFDYALALLRESVQANWTTGTPLPVEYQLLNFAIWEYAADIVNDGATSLIPPGFSKEVLADAATDTPSSESDLLFDTLFDSWYLEGEPVRAVAQEVSELEGGLPNELTDDGWRMLLPALIRLAHEEFSAPLRERYAARLQRMAEWYHIAREGRASLMALQCAHTMLTSPPEANLFVLRLVQKGILVAIAENTRFLH
ncbi:MAG TPA: hypothetical protein VLQ48_11015 [Chloroflexia bacterium]|nr:hypothetical protein [Chloroflexia bacterium]